MFSEGPSGPGILIVLFIPTEQWGTLSIMRSAPWRSLILLTSCVYLGFALMKQVRSASGFALPFVVSYIFHVRTRGIFKEQLKEWNLHDVVIISVNFFISHDVGSYLLPGKKGLNLASAQGLVCTHGATSSPSSPLATQGVLFRCWPEYCNKTL